MYAIENELGRFEADTEREAKKLLRAAQVKARKQEAQLSALRKQARLAACYEGFRVMSQHAQGNECPRAWIYYTSGESYYASLIKRVDDRFGAERKYKISTEYGAVDLDLWGVDIAGCVISGCGWVIALVLQDGRETQLHAFGSSSDGETTVGAWEQIYGVPIEWFQRSKHAEVA